MAEEIKTVNYSDENIITLDGLTHIRRRAGGVVSSDLL